MPHSLENPFANVPAGNPDTASYVEKVLGRAEADKYRKLETRQTTDDRRLTTENIELTDEERARMANREKEIAGQKEAQEKRETRQRLIKWAEEFDLGSDEGLDADGWVEKHFTFLPDGEAMCPRNLFLSKQDVSYIPKGITYIGGYATLSHNLFASVENMPRTIREHLNLSFNDRLTSLEDLPRYIGGDLYLLDIPATTLPAGLIILGSVKIKPHQTELKQDAENKGYKVEIWT